MSRDKKFEDKYKNNQLSGFECELFETYYPYKERCILAEAKLEAECIRHKNTEAKVKELEEKLNNAVYEGMDISADLAGENTALQKENTKLRECVEFYANPDTWQCGLFERGSEKDLLTIAYDSESEGQVCGKKARETLKELEGVKGE